MEAPGEALLTGTGLAGDEHAHRGRSDPVGGSKDAAKRWALADDRLAPLARSKVPEGLAAGSW
jgi:hypothetical protein